METMIREPTCVQLKRRGAEQVAEQVKGMTLEEQLEFWRKRTETMLARQEEYHQNQATHVGCAERNKAHHSR